MCDYVKQQIKLNKVHMREPLKNSTLQGDLKHKYMTFISVYNRD